MTIRVTLLAGLALAAVAACATGMSARRGGLPEEEVATFPEPIAEAYRVFAQKCSRCHTLARPLSADIDDVAHWERYVLRMRRQAGSGISPSDAEEILKFLEYYTKERVAQVGEDEG